MTTGLQREIALWHQFRLEVACADPNTCCIITLLYTAVAIARTPFNKGTMLAQVRTISFTNELMRWKIYAPDQYGGVVEGRTLPSLPSHAGAEPNLAHPSFINNNLESHEMLMFPWDFS